MDNLTHGLLGLAIGMARPREGGAENRRPLTDTDKAVVLGSLLAAEIPDLDVFSGLFVDGGPMAEYIYHRGLTHAILFAPVVAGLAAGLAWLFFRKARYWTLAGWALLSVLIAHLTNDWMTGWGTRLLLPFSEARIGLDWVPIIDLLYTIPLLTAVVMAARRPLQRRRWILGVLTYLLVYTFGYRGLSHTLVERAVVNAYAGQPVAQLRVSPNLFNPASWTFTVDLGDRYEQGEAYVFGAIAPARTVAKQQEDAVIRAVRALPELKPYFDQFAYTVITYEPVATGYRVSMGDVRYQFAGRGIDYQVDLDKNLQLLDVRAGGW